MKFHATCQVGQIRNKKLRFGMNKNTSQQSSFTIAPEVKMSKPTFCQVHCKPKLLLSRTKGPIKSDRNPKSNLLPHKRREGGRIESYRTYTSTQNSCIQVNQVKNLIIKKTRNSQEFQFARRKGRAEESMSRASPVTFW